MTNIDIQRYLNKQTVIAGDVNSGKTTETTSIIELFLKAGHDSQIAVLDLAPDLVDGIGGKLPRYPDTSIRYLTTEIAAPRLMGKDEQHILQLAEENCQRIEKLFTEFKSQKRDILFVNDASLYLQSGSLELFLQIMGLCSTRIINIYYGNTFQDSAMTRRERTLSDALIEASEEVIFL